MKKTLIAAICVIAVTTVFAGEKPAKKLTKPNATCTEVMEDAKRKLDSGRLFVAFIGGDHKSINKMALKFPAFFIEEIYGLTACAADNAYDYAKASSLKIVSVPKTRENEKKLEAMQGD